MAFLQDTVDLAQGVQGADVIFSIPFPATPGVIIPTVRNISGDSEKLQITASLKSADGNGFSVSFDAVIPNANYQLSWIAGTADVMFNLVTSLTGRRHTVLTRLPKRPAAGDLILLTRMAPTPSTEALEFSVLQGMFSERVAVPPTRTSPGKLGQYAISPDGRLYFHTGTFWGRQQLRIDNWNAEDPLSPVPEEDMGEAALAANSQEIVIPFTNTFSAPPHVSFGFKNTVSPEKQLIQALLVGVTTENFTLYLSTPPPDANYKCLWQAKLNP